MRKLALKLEELAVESFDTAPRGSERGTILGNSGYDGCSIYTGECCTPAGTYGGNTCESTCYQIACGCTYPDNTCDLSCGTYAGECVASAHPDACPTHHGYPGC